MTRRARARLEELARRRRELLAELEELAPELREAAVDAVRDGEPAKPVAELAGVSRETLYKWLRAGGVETATLAEERRLQRRYEELDRRRDELVRLKMHEIEPAGGLSRHGRWRSGYQWEQNGRSGSAVKRYEVWARRELEREASPEWVAVCDELDELGRRLESLQESRAGFFAGV